MNKAQCFIVNQLENMATHLRGSFIESAQQHGHVCWDEQGLKTYLKLLAEDINAFLKENSDEKIVRTLKDLIDEQTNKRLEEMRIEDSKML